MGYLYHLVPCMFSGIAFWYLVQGDFICIAGVGGSHIYHFAKVAIMQTSSLTDECLGLILNKQSCETKRRNPYITKSGMFASYEALIKQCPNMMPCDRKDFQRIHLRIDEIMQPSSNCPNSNKNGKNAFFSMFSTEICLH